MRAGAGARACVRAYGCVSLLPFSCSRGGVGWQGADGACADGACSHPAAAGALSARAGARRPRTFDSPRAAAAAAAMSATQPVPSSADGARTTRAR